MKYYISQAVKSHNLYTVTKTCKVDKNINYDADYNPTFAITFITNSKLK